MALKVGQIKDSKLRVVERPIAALDNTVMIRELSIKQIKSIFTDKNLDGQQRIVALIIASLTDEDGYVATEEDVLLLLDSVSNPAAEEIVQQIMIVNGHKGEGGGKI